ncbi:MAG: flagellar biosynthesis protein FlhB [Treponema sp.]|jgi:flagellar biosynthetic protein FlhB|nr:flagellar biosynthesis protein FlhB [Treponema sp.]
MRSEKLPACSDEFMPENNFFPSPNARRSALVIPLQWFADENDEDAPGKTEQPTEHKLQRLREEGQVVKSQELVSAIGLFLPALLLLFMAPSMLRTCVEMVRFFLLRATELDPTQDAIIVGIFFKYLVRLALPVLAVAVISAFFSNLVQLGGWLFTTKPITPNFSRTLPRFGQYFKRIFSVEGLFNLGKSLAKIVIIGMISYAFIFADINKLLNLQKSDPYTGLVLVATIASRMLIVVAALLLVLGIADYFFQRWRFRERHKMTRYEIKEEFKTYEADPQIQGRIRSRFRELLRQNIAVEVKKADVVITNPTHFAIALHFDPALMMSGPVVVAMGADELAARIKKLALDYGIPVVENKPLARALYNEVDVGDVIPEKYITTVALIFSKIWSINEERRLRMSA